MRFSKWLADESKLKGAEVFMAAITLLSAAIWIYLDGFSGETIAQAITTLGAALVIIATFIYKLNTYRISDYEKAGAAALEKLQNEYPNILSGPRFFKDNNKEPKNNWQRYLFFQRHGKGEMAQFIPESPLLMADIEIHVSRKALRILGIDMEQHERIKNIVHDEVREFAIKNYGDFLVSDIQDSTNGTNLCIKLDFIDVVNKLSYDKFQKIVFAIAQKAIETLLVQKGSPSDIQ